MLAEVRTRPTTLRGVLGLAKVRRLGALVEVVFVETFLDRFAPGGIRFAPGFEREWMPLPYMLGPVRLDVEVRESL